MVIIFLPAGRIPSLEKETTRPVKSCTVNVTRSLLGRLYEIVVFPLLGFGMFCPNSNAEAAAERLFTDKVSSEFKRTIGIDNVAPQVPSKNQEVTHSLLQETGIRVLATQDTTARYTLSAFKVTALANGK